MRGSNFACSAMLPSVPLFIRENNAKCYRSYRPWR
ncbi:hypothetical protein SARI_01353 [Salmonella enterica subsp. arizonae serovar 62:z4,z23:-]|uniref:Uncharacterized protein n=1 Tax=Salmonella arizonae (strain ATCC BAA-731 / CDC346-86 / RSK2980) TaxID=41514 RepID=A9MQV7_SALAR|nr:hypothetical protein SARI_01353 [Salmonella enterica subsp. arizonae serovar 62:z4,z23:-]